MILKDVGIMATDSNRARLYLQHMARHGLVPSSAIYLRSPQAATAENRAKLQNTDRPSLIDIDGWTYDMECMVLDTLKASDIPTTVVSDNNPNNDAAVSALKESDAEIMIYAGPGGIILKKTTLSAGKKFLHIHPGVVPEYRGSTTVYYSLLNEGNCGASAFFFDEKIDTGPLIKTKIFAPPDDTSTLDFFYDPYIRAQLLVEVLKHYAETGEFSTQSQTADVGETYYIIHPVLKHIAMLAKP